MIDIPSHQVSLGGKAIHETMRARDIIRGLLEFARPKNLDTTLVDANQIVVSPQVAGRISKLLVDEGSQVKQGDLIALLDPSELEAQERARTRERCCRSTIPLPRHGTILETSNGCTITTGRER